MSGEINGHSFDADPSQYAMEMVTADEADRLLLTEWWEGKDWRYAASRQLCCNYWIMPLLDFHIRVELLLGRKVETYELPFRGLLRDEWLGLKTKPSHEELEALRVP